MNKAAIRRRFDDVVRFLGGAGSIGNAVIGYYFWSEVSPFWGWLWLVLGSLAVVVCLERKPNASTHIFERSENNVKAIVGK